MVCDLRVKWGGQPYALLGVGSVAAQIAIGAWYITYSVCLRGVIVGKLGVQGSY